ncbi:MAG: HigA family addiction module antitoxin [Pacificimonas sp.]
MTTALTAGLAPMHPGELLREIVLPGTDLANADIARRLGISRQHLHNIETEKKTVTPLLACRLPRLFGNTPQLWLRMQEAYDLARVERECGEELERIEPIAA